MLSHISLSNPINFNAFLTQNNFNEIIQYEQNRSLNPQDLNSLCVGLSDYFLELNKENKCIFEIKSDECWEYKVWLKKIVLNS